MPNVYTGGTLWSSISHRKFDSDGELLWEKTCDQTVNGVAVDSDGFMYIAANRTTTYTDSLKKLDSDGDVVWEFDPGGRGASVTVDLNGNVYLGHNVSSGRSLRKLDSDGELLWTKNPSHQTVTGVAADTYDNIYWVSIVGNDYSHGKMDSDGDPVWRKKHTATLNCVAIDLDDDMYIGGNRSTDPDITHQKLDSDGDPIWSKDHGNAVRGIAVDDNGDVYICGVRASDLSHRKLDSDGDPIWSKNHGGTVQAIAVDPDGHVYIGAWGVGVVHFRKLDSDGDPIWSGNHGNIVYGIAVDPGLYGAGFWPDSEELNTYTADTKREINKLYSYEADSTREIVKAYQYTADSIRAVKDLYNLTTLAATDIGTNQARFWANVDIFDGPEEKSYQADSIREILRIDSLSTDTEREIQGLEDYLADTNRNISELLEPDENGYIYNEGDYEDNWVEGAKASSNMNLSKEVDHLFIEMPENDTVVREGTWVSEEKMDLTDWDTLKIDWTLTFYTQDIITEGYMCVTEDSPQSSFDADYEGRVQHAEWPDNLTSSLDVSSLTGEHYIRIHLRVGGNPLKSGRGDLKIHKVWVEAT